MSHPRLGRLPPAVLALAGLLFAGAAGPAATLIETSTQDFLDGSLSDNLYASTRGDGAVEFVWRLDLNRDGYIDVVCPDDTIGLTRVYFGSATGFDTTACRQLPADGGGGVDVADLDCDGRPDLVHSGWHGRHVVVYWGTDSGPSPTDTTQLDVADKSEAVTVADLDRDGWLDLVCGVRMSLVQVFWGSGTGYANANRTDVAVAGKIGHNLDVADLDRDGRLDIAAAAWDQRNNPVVYWGPARAPREVEYLPVSALNPHGVATADLNGDGWLDLVYPGYDTVAPTNIYYGSDSGFTTSRREEILPGLCYGGVTAFDWDADSALDLVFFLGDFPRGEPQPVVVYLNDPGRTPHFVDGDTAEVGAPGFNMSGGLIADFNQDGSNDVFVDVYADSGPSVVLWGPDYLAWDSLPAVASHHGQAREVGNAYDRGFAEDYVSSVLGDTWPSLWHTIAWDESTPGGSDLAMAVRTGDVPVPDSTWSGWLPFGNGDTIPDTLDSRYIQYQAGFSYVNPAALPDLFEVRIDYDPAPYHDVGPIQLIAPNGVMDSGMVVTPRCRVRNFGNRAEVFPVTMQIGADYSRTIEETLAVGQIDTVAFPDWVAGPVDTLAAVCFTALAGDTNPANDTIRAQVVVLRPPRPDVGAVRILSPLGPVDSGSVHYPRVVVENFGPLAASFPVTLTLGDTYQATLYDSLEPGESDTLTFPSWSAVWPGLYRMVCFTHLVGDGNRHNDTVADTVRVLNQPPPDVGAVEILVPGPFADSGMTYVPRATVRNYDRYAAIFPVTMRIGNWHGGTVIETLAAQGVDTVVFDPWVAQPMGVLAVRCYTQQPDDPNPHNDTAESTVLVGPPSVHDIGTDEILAPARSCRAGETIVPWARIVNLGRRAERYFDVRFRIGAGYNRLLNVNYSLEPNATLEVSFPPWVAEQGWHTASCSTMLVGDMDQSNDKRTLDVLVSRNVRLLVEPDTTARILVGETKDYRFRAVFTGDTGAVVDVEEVAAPGGWSAELYDSAGATRLSGTLGYLPAGVVRSFLMRVAAPDPSLRGVVESLGVQRFVVRGRVRGDTAVADSAVLALSLAPYLEVHNFPNPFHGRTKFIIGLPEDGSGTLFIYNRAGEVVRRLLQAEPLRAGVSVVDWDAKNDGGRPVGSGTYRYVFSYEHGGEVDKLVKKLVVTRE